MTMFEKFMGEKFSDYSDKLSSEERQYIIDSDPSGKLKYSDWIFKNILIPARNMELPLTEIRPSVAELKDTLTILFTKIKGEISDINMYERYDELLDTVRKYKAEDRARQFVSAGVIKTTKQDRTGIMDVQYKLFHINNRYGARKFYVNNGQDNASTKTSWCISTDIPSHWERETRHGKMMFVVAETNQPRPWNYLALRIKGDSEDPTVDNTELNIVLDSVWNNGVGSNTSADSYANEVGKKIFEKENVNIQKMWGFHYSQENKPYTEYDSAGDDEYPDMMVKRMIIARMAGRTVGGDYPEFNNDFEYDNQQQVSRIMQHDIPLYIRWLKYCNKDIQIISTDMVEIPISQTQMKDYAERIFDPRGGRHDSTWNWGELYMDENGALDEKIREWFWDINDEVSDMISMLDDRNKATIIALIQQGDPEDVVTNGDEIDIEESLEMDDPHEIISSMRNAVSSAMESSAYRWIEKQIRRDLEEYIGVELMDDWSPWNEKPLSVKLRYTANMVEEDLSMIREGMCEMDTMDPMQARIHYAIEDKGTATVDTERMSNYADDDDFNKYLKDQLPQPKPEGYRHIPEVPGQLELPLDGVDK